MGVELPGDWNSQGSGTPRRVELPGGWNSQRVGTPREVELPGGWNSQRGGTPRGVELPGGWNSQGSGTPRGGGWNSQGGGTPRGGELSVRQNSSRRDSKNLMQILFPDLDGRPRVEINLSDLRSLKASHDSLPHEGFSSCSGLLAETRTPRSPSSVSDLGVVFVHSACKFKSLFA